MELRLLAQPMPGPISAGLRAATALPGLLERKNPQELVRGLSREIGILVSPLDDDEDVWFFWIFKSVYSLVLDKTNVHLYTMLKKSECPRFLS